MKLSPTPLSHLTTKLEIHLVKMQLYRPAPLERTGFPGQWADRLSETDAWTAPPWFCTLLLSRRGICVSVFPFPLRFTVTRLLTPPFYCSLYPRSI